jgi:hypothetical protein
MLNYVLKIKKLGDKIILKEQPIKPNRSYSKFKVKTFQTELPQNINKFGHA